MGDKVKENALGSALAKVRGFNSDKYGLRRFVNLKNFATSIENAERVYDVKNINNHFRGNYSTRPQKKKGFETLKPFKHRKTTLRKTMTMPKPMPAPAYTVSQYLDRSKENASSPQSRNRNENRKCLMNYNANKRKKINKVVAPVMYSHNNYTDLASRVLSSILTTNENQLPSQQRRYSNKYNSNHY